MALKMVKLWRDPKSGAWKSRKVIPADVRPAFGGQRNICPTLSASLKPAEAKAEWASWLSTVEERIERHRKAIRGEVLALSERDVAALAGRWYIDQVQEYEPNPGDAEGWRVSLQDMEPDDDDETYEAFHQWAARTDELRRMGIANPPPYDGPSRPWKNTGHLQTAMDQLLDREGLAIDPSSRDALLEAMCERYRDLCRLMIDRAHGDWSPDPLPLKLPAWEAPGARARRASFLGLSGVDGFRKIRSSSC